MRWPFTRRHWQWLVPIAGVGTLGVVYVLTHPRVFNESFWGHAHCITAGGLTLQGYALQHGGRFPYHPKGYGNALLLLDEKTFHTLTGPGYSDAPFLEARRSKSDLLDEACGRVYVQGLSMNSNRDIALLFDKVPTPGGDHCAFVSRMWAPLGREVWFVCGSQRFIEESAWAEFANAQVELLVKEGLARQEAERLYALQPKQ